MGRSHALDWKTSAALNDDKGMHSAADDNSTTHCENATSRPFLRIKLEGELVGHHVLNQPRITLGRSSVSDIVLDATSGVSRNHAHILIVDGEALIEDLSSRNGTFVNGRVCKRRTLKDGDRIAIGRYRLRFRRKSARPSREGAPRSGLAELMLKWNAAAVTGRGPGCPRCATIAGEKTTAGNLDDTQTEALPRLVDANPERAERPVQSGPDGDDPCADDHSELSQTSAAVPSGVASAGDTVNHIAIPFFE